MEIVQEEKRKREQGRISGMIQMFQSLSTAPVCIDGFVSVRCFEDA